MMSCRSYEWKCHLETVRNPASTWSEPTIGVTKHNSIAQPFICTITQQTGAVESMVADRKGRGARKLRHPPENNVEVQGTLKAPVKIISYHNFPAPSSLYLSGTEHCSCPFTLQPHNYPQTLSLRYWSFWLTDEGARYTPSAPGQNMIRQTVPSARKPGTERRSYLPWQA